MLNPMLTHNLNTRVTAPEKAVILAAAKAKRLTISQYVRRKLGLKAKEARL